MIKLRDVLLGFYIGAIFGILFTCFILSAFDRINYDNLDNNLVDMDIQLNKIEQYIDQAIPIYALMDTVNTLIQSQASFTYIVDDTQQGGMGGQDPNAPIKER